ncbi:MAG: peptidoglycan editing factor PgeF [Xanthomonadales bacterium]|nr:peptidoglycan editing factor PgeF [Xanthomonadales bacterium]
MRPDWIVPDWPAPAGIRAISTTRSGGHSRGPYRSLNLGDRCGDDPRAVQRNRERLASALPEAPNWLKQVHGKRVVRHGEAAASSCEADAVLAWEPEAVCAVMTADCLPVLFCSRQGDRVAAAHAGWRGLAAGVLPATVSALDSPPGELLAWLGPAIGPARYEVGREVAEAFSGGYAEAFRPSGERWLMDLYAIARIQLRHCGLEAIYGGEFCTYSEPDRFFSHRRDGATGRMASLVWRE